MRMIEADVKTVAFVLYHLHKVSAIDFEAVTRGRRGIPGGCEPADPSITHAEQATYLVGSALSCVCDERVGIGLGNADS